MTIGSATAFRESVTRFPPHIEIAPLLLPGRESRFAEPPDFNVSDIASAIADHVTRITRLSYAIYP